MLPRKSWLLLVCSSLVRRSRLRFGFFAGDQQAVGGGELSCRCPNQPYQCAQHSMRDQCLDAADTSVQGPLRRRPVMEKLRVFMPKSQCALTRLHMLCPWGDIAQTLTRLYTCLHIIVEAPMLDAMPLEASIQEVQH
ncbi:hypothetical protein EXIGLDRAFT_721435 [Exidia glandulosa HHB12029]|uniref:Uncharacterized protein n=1 Tax=Exidia glandulosa HHB12029 TaxID=1314781 RepID=A0A165FRJ6_EXIGL|nr:hypothetical protein EXIGLDRAFT_721435 [Exidia glandulosa HHB12029]